MDEEIISMGRKVKSPLLNRKREQLSLGDRSLWVTPTENEAHKSEVAMPNNLIHTGVANMSVLRVPSLGQDRGLLLSSPEAGNQAPDSCFHILASIPGTEHLQEASGPALCLVPWSFRLCVSSMSYYLDCDRIRPLEYFLESRKPLLSVSLPGP